MPEKSNPELLLAQTLAAPFTPRSQGNPLSFRKLADGGMVVIACDGRKLWFTAAEVAEANRRLEEQAKSLARALSVSVKTPPIKLAAIPKPEPRANSGIPLRTATPSDMKVKNDHPGNS